MMTYHRLMAAALVVYALSGSPAVHAAEGAASPGATPEKPNRPSLMQADANADGKVSLEEIHAKMPRFPAERFATLDKNGDGALDKTELPNRGSEMAGEHLERLRAADTNQDKRVSKEEFTVQFPDAPDARFAALDRNSDGFLDRQDRADSPASAMKPEPEKKDGAKAASNVYLEKLVHKHDSDGDGRVTMAELRAAKRGFPEAVFGALDRDKDGALTQADAEATRSTPPTDKTKKAPAKKATEENPGKPAAEKKMKEGKKHPPLDVNNDGSITFEEAQSVLPNYTREQFNKRDKNGDGAITKADRAQS